MLQNNKIRKIHYVGLQTHWKLKSINFNKEFIRTRRAVGRAVKGWRGGGREKEIKRV